IAEHATRRLEQAVLEVVPNGIASAPVTIGGVAMYRVTDSSGALCGWATPAESRGFQDKIRLMVGLSKNGDQVTGLTVLESFETPGLGDRIQQREFREQFIGQSTAQPFARVKPGESAPAPVHAITGATISSQAVINAINSQLFVIREELAANPDAIAEPKP
ncbi:MAG: FMN-binding protein, partial [Planctomycetaceae bacterium]